MRQRTNLVRGSFAARSPALQRIQFSIPSRSLQRSDTAQTATQAFASRQILHRTTRTPGPSANPFQAHLVPQPLNARAVPPATYTKLFSTKRTAPTALQRAYLCSRIEFTPEERHYACQSPPQPMLHSANDYARRWPQLCNPSNAALPLSRGRLSNALHMP